MAFVPALAYLGGTTLVVAAADRISKMFAGPGVANEGRPRVAAALVGAAETSARSPVAEDALGRGCCRLLVIYGASGPSGVALVQTALERRFAVRAFVRSAERLARELGEWAGHERLEVVEGDLADLQAVEAAVSGAEAVISVAGARPETAPGPMAAAVPAMVSGCRKHGVKKLIVQACGLSAVPGERWGLLTQGRLARAIVSWQCSSNVPADNERVMQYLYSDAADIDWVVSRPPFLEDGDRLAPLVASLDPFRPATVRCLDLADWTLAQVDCDDYVKKMPRLFYPPVQVSF